MACKPPNASACPAAPYIQVYDVLADESERNNLAESNATLVAELMEVVRRYNASAYVTALNLVTPVENKCPYNDATGSVTPCDP